ncbi:putative nuclease HARBI1 [Diabrotica virgifera virgifera]|uniref:DDE Tnp4 domain-containing protein n=1 Tax=Diabrotica virgifera virgifera TaxID=50390 RepID=A0ABM5L2F5_DIAVI|nr:putative nuclease HARBI1 [Diabrotica virgifera virgifera]
MENNLLTELLTVDGDFQNFTRLPFEKFVELHEKIAPLITKQETHMRSSISSKLRLAVTLRYLASGNSYKSLEFLSRISRITIGNFVPEVCHAIVIVLKDKFLKVPSSKEEWQKISSEFKEKWHFPHAIGALDGKHVAIRAPANEGSYYYNYKGFHSLVLLALVDANYKFIYVDCGGNGRISDGGVYRNSSLYAAVNVNNVLQIPPPEPLPGKRNPLPYCIIVYCDRSGMIHNEEKVTVKPRLPNSRCDNSELLCETAA